MLQLEAGTPQPQFPGNLLFLVAFPKQGVQQAPGPPAHDVRAMRQRGPNIQDAPLGIRANHRHAAVPNPGDQVLTQPREPRCPPIPNPLPPQGRQIRGGEARGHALRGVGKACHLPALGCVAGIRRATEPTATALAVSRPRPVRANAAPPDAQDLP